MRWAGRACSASLATTQWRSRDHHPEALGHQFPTLLQLHGSEFPDTVELRTVPVIHRRGVDPPLPGLRAVLYGNRRPILFIVDTRGLTLAARGMQSPTTMGLDLTRAQRLEALTRGARVVPEAGLGALIFDP